MKSAKVKAAEEEVSLRTEGERRAAMTWASRLKRVFAIDIETCSQCGGAVKIIACIEDKTTIDKILTHLGMHSSQIEPTLLPENRGPPEKSLLDSI